MKKVDLLVAALFLAIQSDARAFTHTCGSGLLPWSWQTPLNPTVYTTVGLTAQERQQWEGWKTWNWYQSTTFSQTIVDGRTMDEGSGGTFYFTYLPEAGNYVTLRSDFQMYRSYYNAFGGPWYDYYPPYEPHRCTSPGTVEDNPNV